jgi:hypothetical protein
MCDCAGAALSDRSCLQSDAAHDTLHELGHVGAIQFKDLNTEKSAFQRIFVQVSLTLSL